MPKYNLSRQDIFITTKLRKYLFFKICTYFAWEFLFPDPADQGEKAYSALETSLKKLDSGYIDLYLIHWPGVFGVNSSLDENRKRRDESWKQLVKGVKNGLVRNIGVSNYNVKHLKELMANDHGIKPAVNQVRNKLKIFPLTMICIQCTYIPLK